MASPIYVPGVPTTVRRPGYFFAVVPGGGSGGGTGVPKLLLMGNMIATALSGASPAFAVAAGTRQAAGVADETPVQVGPASEAATLFGRGSFLHRMARLVRDIDPNSDSLELWACPVAEGGGATKAAATLTFVGVPTSSGTLRLVIDGVAIDIAVTSGDPIATISANAATAIVAQNADLPVTAQFAAGVLTVTAKHGGTKGNDISFRAYWIDGTTAIPIGTSTSKFGTAATITGAGHLAAGATGDSYANALAALSLDRYHRVAVDAPSTDTTNLNRVRDAMIAAAVATSMRWEQGVAGSVSTPSTAVTNATAVLQERIQIVDAENNDLLPAELAAAVAAARLAGDSRFSSNPVPGETADPGCNLNGLQLPIPVPASVLDRPTDAEIETMVRGGVSPLQPSASRPGYMELVTSLTTRFKDADGNVDYSVGKTKIMTVLDDAAEFIRNDFAAKYRGFKLAPDPAGDAPMDVPRVLTPNIAKDRVLALLAQKEGDGTVINVAALEGELRVQINATNKNRLDMDIPVEPIPDLDQVAAVVRQRSA